MAKNQLKKEDETRIFAFLATFLTIIGFIIALLSKRYDKYVMFYAKQGLVLFIIQIIASGARILPLIGKMTSVVIWVIFLICWILSWINALSGEMKNTFIVGNFAKKIRL